MELDKCRMRMLSTGNTAQLSLDACMNLLAHNDARDVLPCQMQQLDACGALQRISHGASASPAWPAKEHKEASMRCATGRPDGCNTANKGL